MADRNPRELIKIARMYQRRMISEDDVLLCVELGKITKAQATQILTPNEEDLEVQTKLRLIRQRDAAVAALQTFVDAGKLAVADLETVPSAFQAWIAGEQVKPGDIRVSMDALFQCLQTHMTQDDWRPEQTPALWKRLGTQAQAQDEWPPFVKPTGSHDAYQPGSKVTFQGQHYTSVINGNVWTPIEYPAGWQIEA